MTIRRRPIPKGDYRWQRAPKGPSLRYELICNGSVRRYPDGREVCEDSPAGYAEYKRRVGLMLQIQGYRCCLCEKRLSASDATFEHQRRRGMGSAFRDDRIFDEVGRKLNGVSHWVCNVERG